MTAILVAFGLERSLARLSISPCKDEFVLKGGMLVMLWTRDRARFARDIDFLGFGSKDEDDSLKIFREAPAFDAEDGLVFDTAKSSAAQIREDHVHGGTRLKTNACVGKTIMLFRIDIEFGDALSAPDFKIDYPSLLDYPDASIRAYSSASVMAEKFQEVVAHGIGRDMGCDSSRRGRRNGTSAARRRVEAFAGPLERPRHRPDAACSGRQ